MNPKYPIYIISKGRAESRFTSKALEEMNVPYHIVIEPQEYNEYSKYINKNKILILPFKNLGEGATPARNWVWEHSISIGAKRHWILDDNMSGFFRLNKNLKVPVDSGTIFKCAEDFVDRYENIAISGFEYFMFAPRKSKLSPFRLNTRVYSCILIQNNIPYRWRGRMNEDTDLCLNALKDGWCTILFMAFLTDKQQTMTMEGGNTDENYIESDNPEDDGRWQMAKILQDYHPDVTTITRKWGRWQHHVNYKSFRFNKLKKIKGLHIPNRENNYGMKLIQLEDK